MVSMIIGVRPSSSFKLSEAYSKCYWLPHKGQVTVAALGSNSVISGSRDLVPCIWQIWTLTRKMFGQSTSISFQVSGRILPDSVQFMKTYTTNVNLSHAPL